MKSNNKGLVSRRALSKAASTSFVHGIGICTSRSQSPEFAVGFQHSRIVPVLPLCPQLLPEFLDCSSHLDAKTRAAAIEFRKAISPKGVTLPREMSSCKNHLLWVVAAEKYPNHTSDVPSNSVSAKCVREHLKMLDNIRGCLTQSGGGTEPPSGLKNRSLFSDPIRKEINSGSSVDGTRWLPWRRMPPGIRTTTAGRA